MPERRSYSPGTLLIIVVASFAAIGCLVAIASLLDGPYLRSIVAANLAPRNAYFLTVSIGPALMLVFQLLVSLRLRHAKYIAAVPVAVGCSLLLALLPPKKYPTYNPEAATAGLSDAQWSAVMTGAVVAFVAGLACGPAFEAILMRLFLRGDRERAPRPNAEETLAGERAWRARATVIAALVAVVAVGIGALIVERRDPDEPVKGRYERAAYVLRIERQLRDDPVVNELTVREIRPRSCSPNDLRSFFSGVDLEDCVDALELRVEPTASVEQDAVTVWYVEFEDRSAARRAMDALRRAAPQGAGLLPANSVVVAASDVEQEEIIRDMQLLPLDLQATNAF